MRKFKFYAFLLQPFLLFVMLCYAYAPIWLGDDIFIKTQGYDPRDFFRGNYVDLRYDFNQMDIDESYKTGNKTYKIYAILQKEGEFYKTSKLSFEKPKSGTYISGKFDYTAHFGVEKFFKSKQKALELEKQLASEEFEAIAHLKIYKGEARLVDVMLVDNNKSNE